MTDEREVRETEFGSGRGAGAGAGAMGVTGGAADPDEISLLDLALVLVKRKKLIFWMTFGVAFLVAVYSLVTPKIYRAETRLLPPKSAEVGASALLDMATGGAASALAGKTPGDLYVGIAKGRTVMDKVVARFKLAEVYEIDNPDRVRAALSANLEAKSDLKTGIISIAVLDKDPAWAADIANGFVDALKDVTSGLAISEAAQKRLYYETQIRDVQAALPSTDRGSGGFGHTG